ncbi:hypothetical protein D3C86_1918920 [compost metagenome]
MMATAVPSRGQKRSFTGSLLKVRRLPQVGQRYPEILRRVLTLPATASTIAR